MSIAPSFLQECYAWKDSEIHIIYSHYKYNVLILCRNNQNSYSIWSYYTKWISVSNNHEILLWEYLGLDRMGCDCLMFQTARELVICDTNEDCQSSNTILSFHDNMNIVQNRNILKRVWVSIIVHNEVWIYVKIKKLTKHFWQNVIIERLCCNAERLCCNNSKYIMLASLFLNLRNS